MPEFTIGDKVRVEMPRGYNKRGVLGVSVLYTTSPEAKFEGAQGLITEINPQGPYSVHQYLVDFRPFDNSRVGIPWQAHWFREEWLDLIERAVDNETIAGVEPSTASTAPRAAPAG